MTHNIKEAKYEGYLWTSDQSKPKMLDGNAPFSITLKDGENPFIIEGLLWNPDENESTTIRYVDGHYFVATHEVNQEQLEGNSNTTRVSYIAHRLPGVSKLKFLRLWEKLSDPLCENMDTLQLKATLFVGFEK